MGKKYNQLKIKVFFLFVLAVAILLSALSPPLEARKPMRWRAKKIVVIDPGHGGHDSGARGPSGVAEKDVTLDLARRIESALKNRFKANLTRTDDYWLEVIRRTDVANHLKADVFISIHAGGSFQHEARGSSVFYFRETSSASPTAASKAQNNWDRLQVKHITKSKSLAEALRKRLEETLPDRRCQLDAEPLLVLRGADMPAVLIEVGYLTNTEDEKQLIEEDTLIRLGQAIADGVNDFLRKLDARSIQ